jgi:SOS-response transcriptional repressor LexA
MEVPVRIRQGRQKKNIILKMNKYERLKLELEQSGRGKMTCFGNSMRPILKSGSTLSFIKSTTYTLGDIVFCKVKGRWIDVHKIVNIHPQKGYLIANNHGWENGWTHTIFGKAVECEYQGKVQIL